MFDHARQLRPDDVEILKLLAKVFMATGRADLARERLTECIRLQPTTAEARLLLDKLEKK